MGVQTEAMTYRRLAELMIERDQAMYAVHAAEKQVKATRKGTKARRIAERTLASTLATYHTLQGEVRGAVILLSED